MIKIYEDLTTINQLTANLEMLDALESGALIYFPKVAFEVLPVEEPLLKANLVPFKSKNISYNANTKELKALDKEHLGYTTVLKNMMQRYADFSQTMLTTLFPHYQEHLTRARTSFRPVEILGRKHASFRKDDTRLHVDAFPGTPCQGRRLLRVFTNINQNGKSRLWRIGEPFESVVEQFKSQLKFPPAFYKYLIKILGITRGLCTNYDALMLQLHNAMKFDLDYQKTVKQQTVDLAAGSVWIVYTDQVSHAAMEGQFCLEQTFVLPVEGMKNPEKSPLHILQREYQRSLV